MEEDIRQHKFLEYGEHNGNMYGTALDSIRDIIRQGKMCVLDCSPAVSALLLNYICIEFLKWCNWCDVTACIVLCKHRILSLDSIVVMLLML